MGIGAQSAPARLFSLPQRLRGESLRAAGVVTNAIAAGSGSLANSINRAGQTIAEAFDPSTPVALALPAGSFSLHHEFAVHRSAPNRAAHRRIGIGLNYIPTHVRVNGSVRLCAMLVRGEDRFGHFDLIAPPEAERDPAALAVHQQVSDRYRKNYNEQVRRHEEQFAGALA